MVLKEKLDARRAGAKDRFPLQDLAVMRRATEDLRNSGIVRSALRTGDRAPSWTVHSSGGGVRSADLLARGPLVLSFFRGVW